VTFEIIPTTAFKRGKDKATPTDLKAGMRVVVVTDGEGNPQKAHEIQYSSSTTAEKKQ